MTSLLLIIIGMFIGWNLPQPQFAKNIQDKAVSLLRDKGLIK
jgi:hypothetical protein